jgi:hypothetical protein
MKKVVIVGGGVSGLFLSLFLLKQNHKVHLFEKTSSLGKKFLVAGKSDLNITNSENLDVFCAHYTPRIDDSIKYFSNDSLISFLKEEFDIDTFTGTSGRVFPKDIKASKILKVIVDSLKANPDFTLGLNSNLENFSDDKIQFSAGEVTDFDAAVFCLGGASWKITGSDGSWLKTFKDKNISTTEFKASNCSIELNLSDYFKEKVSHHFIKNVKLECEKESVQGDIVFNGTKMEGTPIYTMSRFFRENKKVSFNFKPDMELVKLKRIIDKRDSKKSIVTFLKTTLKLDPFIYSLWREFHSTDEIKNKLFEMISSFEISNYKLAPIDEAISTIGGVEMSEVDSNYKLKQFNKLYSIGEMLNWDTITGGYLIQGCISQAFHVSKALS